MILLKANIRVKQSRYQLFLFFIMILSLTINGQEPQKTRKELRQKRQENKVEEVSKIISDKSFVFNATHAMPLGGKSIQLNHSFDAEIKRDTLISYLPFFGVAYRIDYGATDAAFDFILPIIKYKYEKNTKGHYINLEVKNRMDYLVYTFHISDLGYATLSITSTNRQSISFFGRIEKP